MMANKFDLSEYETSFFTWTLRKDFVFKIIRWHDKYPTSETTRRDGCTARLQQMGECLLFKEEICEALHEHEVFYRDAALRYKKFSALLYYLLNTPSIVCFSILITLTLTPLLFPKSNGQLYVSISESGVLLSLLALCGIAVFVLFTAVFFTTLADKLSAALFLSGAADSYLTYELVYLLFDLNCSRILSDPVRRNCLKARMKNVIHAVSLLQSATLTTQNKWSDEHFQQLTRFVTDRYQWACVPRGGTLDILRNDFYDFTILVVEGRFGDFEWQENTNDAGLPVHKKDSSIFSFLSFILTISPPLVMGVALWERAWLESVKISPNLVVIALFSWLVILIDTKLNLGVIDKFVSLGKGIRGMG